MAKFVKAPVPESEDDTPAAAAESVLADFGIATGLPGAILLGIAAIFLLITLFKLLRFVAGRAGPALVEGEITEVEPAIGGGFHPVIVYPDAEGRRRRFIAETRIGADETGRRVLVTLERGRPVIAPAPPSALREAIGLILPFAIALLAGLTGLTGKLAGVMPLPWL